MEPGKTFKFSTDRDDIGVLVFDLEGEKVNKICRAIGEGFSTVLKELSGNKKLKGLVLISGKPDIFIAGADINEFTQIKNKDEAFQLSSNAQKLADQLEDLPFPTVAAINGACLGGGLEIALACKYRVATDDRKTTIGFPEVMLGIIPGMGGCVRAPKLLGIERAFDLILAAKQVDGVKAKRIGLVNDVVSKEKLLDTAKWLLKKPPKIASKFNIKELILEKNVLGRQVLAGFAKKAVLAKSGGHYPAPLKAIDVVITAFGKPRSEAMRIEAEGFAEMAVTDVSKNLVRLFFLQEEAKRERGENKDVRTRDIMSAAVLGAGVMGGGISYLMTARDVEVRLRDISEKALDHANEHAKSLFEKRVEKKQMRSDDVAKKLRHLHLTTAYDGFEKVELVIEAVPESMKIKEAVYKEVCAKVSDNTIIATNTSTFSLAMLKPFVTHPERFVGMHFFNPVHKLPLLEVVRMKDSDPEVVATALKFGQRVGKVTLLCNDGPGFVANRLIGPYLIEGTWLLVEGVSVEEIDKPAVRFGYPSGPLRTMDEVGFDTGVHVVNSFYKTFGERMKPAPVIEYIMKSGRLGHKNNKGIYLYSGKHPGKDVDQTIYDELKTIQRKPKGSVSSEEILKRLIYCQVNEASRLIEEGVARRPRDVDVASIWGLGFPPFRGGILSYANSVGIRNIVDDLKRFAEKYGVRFSPAASLAAMAEKNQKFAVGFASS